MKTWTHGHRDHQNVGEWTMCGSLGIARKGGLKVGLEDRGGKSIGGGGDAFICLVG